MLSQGYERKSVALYKLNLLIGCPRLDSFGAFSFDCRYGFWSINEYGPRPKLLPHTMVNT